MKFDLFDLTDTRFGATQISPPTNVSAKIRLKAVSSPTVIHIDASYTLGGTFHIILSSVNEELLSRPSGALFELALPMLTFGSNSDHETAMFSKSTPNIYPS